MKDNSNSVFTLKRNNLIPNKIGQLTIQNKIKEFFPD